MSFRVPVPEYSVPFMYKSIIEGRNKVAEDEEKSYANRP